MKERLKKEYGTLRVCSKKTGVNYYRLSSIINGWVVPKPEEVKLLKITPKELKANG